MKKDTLITLAAAALGIFAVYQITRKPATYRGMASSLNNGGTVPVEMVRNAALPGQPGWGWQNFTDGVSIGPDGSYYKNGQQVWTPAG